MILVFGQTGQVAQELRRLAPEAHFEARFLGRAEADLADPDACAAAIRGSGASAVINAAAYTAVDQAENEEALAATVNGTAPGAMARACAEIGAPFVHFSTDYVFDGGGGGTGTAPRRPDEAMAPLNAYGRTKLAGEAAVRASGAVFAVLRTSWVFSAHGKNFVKTMLRLSETRDALTIVEDQIGGPTPAAAIAAACLSIAEQLRADPTKAGTYHFTGAPDVSWKGFAEAIFAEAKRDVTVAGIPTTDYPTPAKRPLNSRLDCQSMTDTFGLPRPDWRQGLTNVLRKLSAMENS
ncbi:MAG: dTDP-4-dehydrorhamnose reductase [Pseudomonadota bacterium]